MISNKRTWTVAMFVVFALTASLVEAKRAQRVEDALWGAGVTWDTVLTPTSFKKAPSHSVDLLYNFSMSGLMGQRRQHGKKTVLWMTTYVRSMILTLCIWNRGMALQASLCLMGALQPVI